MSDLLLRLSQHWLAHELWKHLRRRPTLAVHDRFKTSGVGWPMTYVSYGRSMAAGIQDCRSVPQRYCYFRERGHCPSQLPHSTVVGVRVRSWVHHRQGGRKMCMMHVPVELKCLHAYDEIHARGRTCCFRSINKHSTYSYY
jgi:hypothetical protein